MRAHQADYPIAMMARVLDVSTSGFYAWRKRGPSKRARQDAWLLERIETSHEESKGTYGAPRIHAELRDQGIRVGRKRVARLMREAGLAGVSRRRGTRTTIRDDQRRPAPDLVDRNFQASGPNELWVADITYVPTWQGFLYLAVVVDAWSRRVVGWAMQTHLRTELVLEALDMAVWQRRPREVIHHSDQGSQYASIAFGSRCKRAGVRPSMGSVGDCYDNAMCESFFATLDCELIDRVRLRAPREAKRTVFEWIEGWYNPRRRHSSLGYLAPAEFERRAVGEVVVDAAGQEPVRA
jgi:putative transposase